MVTITYKPITIFDTVITDAASACSTGPLHNLLLAYEFSPELLDSQFIALHRRKAEEWQADPPPSNLFFSHGQYFRGETGIQHVIDELKAKASSRRALLSLTDMATFIESGDSAVPSFMIAQFALEADVLYVTEYFRALEVGSFLKINLTEAALLCNRIVEAIRRPRVIRLCMLAFQAHFTPAFHCLEKAALDMASGPQIGVVVAKKDTELLMEWLQGKKAQESEIITRGLSDLVASVIHSGEYSSAFRSQLERALQKLVEIKKLRSSSSLETTVENRWRDYLEILDEAIGELRRMRNGT